MLPVVIVTSVSPELAATATERLLSRGGTVGISYAGHPQRRVIRTSSEVVDVCDVQRESDCVTCDIASVLQAPRRCSLIWVVGRQW